MAKMFRSHSLWSSILISEQRRNRLRPEQEINSDPFTQLKNRIMINQRNIGNDIHKDFREFFLRKTLSKTMEIQFENPS